MKNLKAPLLVSLTGLALVACGGGGGSSSSNNGGGGGSPTESGWTQVGNSKSFVGNFGSSFMYDNLTKNIYFNSIQNAVSVLCSINASANTTVIPTCVSIEQAGFTKQTNPVGNGNGSIYWIAKSSTFPNNPYIFTYDTSSGVVSQNAKIDSTVIINSSMSSYSNGQIFVNGYNLPTITDLLSINVETGATSPYITSFASIPTAFTVGNSMVYFVGSSLTPSIYAQAQQSNTASVIGNSSMPTNGFNTSGVYINNNLIYACPMSVNGIVNGGVAYLNTTGDNVWNYLPATSTATILSTLSSSCMYVTTDTNTNVFTAGSIYVESSGSLTGYDVQFQIMKYNG